MASLSIPQRALIALNHLGPSTTGQIAKAINADSGSLAARMLSLEDAGQVRRIDGGSGRGQRATWEIVRC